MSSGATEPFEIDSENAKVDDVNSVFSTEVALSFDHILEQIFDLLGSTDLLNCRLVSHRWLFFAQKPLQKQISLSFFDNEQRIRNPTNRDASSSPKHLSELTKLLKLGQSLADCEASENVHNISILFPCNKFHFECISLSNDDLQHFFNTNGQNIRELFLGSYSEDTPDENILMDQIAHLLLNQAPNIQEIYLSINPTVNWKIGDPDRSHRSQLQPTDPEYKEIFQKTRDLLQYSKSGSSLKILDLYGEGLAKVLEFMTRISPRLEEIILDSECYKYLLVPENRLCKLKSLTFIINPSDNSSVVEMEKISCGNFKLKKIELNLDYVTQWTQKCPADFEKLQKIVQMINKIFQGSWDTLEEIEFNKFSFLRGMKLPEVMPKVKEIEIRDNRNETNEEADANSVPNVTVFPLGFNLQKTFPKLRCVHLANYTEFDDIAIFSCFLNCLHFGTDPCDPLSTSVRRVTLSAMCFDNESEPVHPLISQRIQRWFPNARVELLD